MPGPLQDIPSQATKVVDDAGNIATHAPIAVSEATRVAAEAVEKVHTAVGAVESLVGQLMAKGCEFGTVYACFDYGDDTKCTPYLKNGQGPWNELGDLIGHSGHSEGLSKNIASLQSKIGTLENLQVFAILGIVFAAMALLFSKATPIWFPFKVVVAIVSNMIAVAMFAVLVSIVAIIYAVGKGFEGVTKGEMEVGSVLPISIVILVLSLAQTVMIIVEMLPCW